MTPWLLIPVKAFAKGKSRLRPVLAEDTRCALNEFFLRRMLATARQFPGSARTAVISECRHVLEIAAACGVQALRQRSGPGLNRAASEGMATIRRRGADFVLLIASDLPTLRARDLRELADRPGCGNGIVICPDKDRTGTNAILLPKGAHLRFRFGKGSFLGHCGEAMRAGFAPIVHFNPRIAFDVDSPQDLVRWSGAPAVLAGAAISASRGAEGPCRRSLWSPRPGAPRRLRRAQRRRG